MSAPQPEWLTIGEAAALVGVSASTLRRYERDGFIQSRRTPTNQRRYRRADVEKLLPAPKKAG
jgi:excisionase family DNA binding protein